MEKRIQAAIYRVNIGDDNHIHLQDIDAVAVVCDSQGNRLGHYVPVQVPLGVVDTMRQCPFSEAELEQRDQDVDGVPLANFLKSLEQSA